MSNPKKKRPRLRDEPPIWEYVYKSICNQKIDQNVSIQLFRRYLDENPDVECSPEEIYEYFNSQMRKTLYKQEMPVEKMLDLFKAIRIEITEHMESMIRFRCERVNLDLDDDRRLLDFSFRSGGQGIIVESDSDEENARRERREEARSDSDEEDTRGEARSRQDAEMVRRLSEAVESAERENAPYEDSIRSSGFRKRHRKPIDYFGIGGLEEDVEMDEQPRSSQEPRRLGISADMTTPKRCITAWKPRRSDILTPRVNNNEPSTSSSRNAAPNSSTSSNSSHRQPLRCLSSSSSSVSLLRSPSESPPRKKEKKRRSFWFREDEINALKFLYEKMKEAETDEGMIVKPKGNQIWRLFTKRSDTGKSPENWSSHFRKQMCPVLYKYELDPEKKLYLMMKMETKVDQKTLDLLQEECNAKIHLNRYRTISSWEYNWNRRDPGNPGNPENSGNQEDSDSDDTPPEDDEDSSEKEDEDSDDSLPSTHVKEEVEDSPGEARREIKEEMLQESDSDSEEEVNPQDPEEEAAPESMDDTESIGSTWDLRPFLQTQNPTTTTPAPESIEVSVNEIDWEKEEEENVGCPTAPPSYPEFYNLNPSGETIREEAPRQGTPGENPSREAPEDAPEDIAEENPEEHPRREDPEDAPEVIPEVAPRQEAPEEAQPFTEEYVCVTGNFRWKRRMEQGRDRQKKARKISEDPTAEDIDPLLETIKMTKEEFYKIFGGSINENVMKALRKAADTLVFAIIRQNFV
uniref:SPK domain-containing protein n=1 Tax=Caenorhabditis tropicalis TaxID=1561998 RepID=A0A1I7U5J6_9PELO